MSNPVYDLLHKTQVKDVTNVHKTVHSIQSGDSILQCIQIMDEQKLLSLPVFKGDECIGFVDTQDIVSYVLQVVPENDVNEYMNLLASGTTKRALEMPSVDRVVGVSGTDPLVPVYEKTPVTELMDLFACGIHRAVVFGDASAVKTTISQSDIIRFAAEHVHVGHCKDLGEKKISELMLSSLSSSVLTIKDTDSVFAALKLLGTKKVGGVAVVNEEGVLVGNFSCSDIRGIYKQDVPRFEMSLRDFLEANSERSLKPVCAHKDISLTDACRLFKEESVHHFWVVDNDRKPIGIVSLTDMVCVFKNKDLRV